MKLAIIVFLFVTACSSQDVKVKHVDPALSTRARNAWQALKAAEVAWGDVKTETQARYMKDGPNFSFSDDFTVIVPTGTAALSGSGTVSWPCGILTTPVNGTNQSWPISNIR